jgi:hypothetical protein
MPGNVQKRVRSVIEEIDKHNRLNTDQLDEMTIEIDLMQGVKSDSLEGCLASIEKNADEIKRPSEIIFRVKNALISLGNKEGNINKAMNLYKRKATKQIEKG